MAIKMRVAYYRMKNYFKRNGFVKTYHKVTEKLISSKKHHELNKDYILEDDWFKKKELFITPKISIIVPVFNTDQVFLKEMIESVLSQSYSNFELCLFDAGSSASYTKLVLNEYLNRDHRIKILFSPKNEGIALNTNKAIEMATGDYIGLLDHDDLLSKEALYEVVREINQSNPDVLYSDEDKITSNGKEHLEAHIKSKWAPDTLLSYNYICHFLVVRASILKKVGGLRKEYEGSQDFDLVLRLSTLTQNIVHIPKVLYHWRISETSTAFDMSKKGYAIEAGRKAVQSYLIHNNLDYNVTMGEYLGSFHVDYKNKKHENHSYFSIFIYGKRNKQDEIINYINQMKLTGKKVFIVFFSTTIDYSYKILDYIQVIGVLNKSFTGLFNNILEQVETEYLYFFYDNISYFEDMWFNNLYSAAQQEHISIVSSKIINRKNKIHSFGLAIDKTGVYDIHNHLNKNYFGYMGRLKISQNVTAASPEALLIKKDYLIKCGGLNEVFQTPIAMLDYCLKQPNFKKYIKIIPLELFSAYDSYWKDEQEINKLLEVNKSNLAERDAFYPLYKY